MISTATLLMHEQDILQKVYRVGCHTAVCLTVTAAVPRLIRSIAPELHACSIWAAVPAAIPLHSMHLKDKRLCMKGRPRCANSPVCSARESERLGRQSSIEHGQAH